MDEVETRISSQSITEQNIHNITSRDIQRSVIVIIIKYFIIVLVDGSSSSTCHVPSLWTRSSNQRIKVVVEEMRVIVRVDLNQFH